MAQFQLEQELQSALRLDTSLNVAKAGSRGTSHRSRAAGTSSSFLNSSKSGSGSNTSLSTSRLLSAASAAAGAAAGAPSLVRSNSASRLSPSRFRASTSPSRSGSRTPSLGRNTGTGDRFIPNRSTTDMESAHFTVINKENASGNAPGDPGSSGGDESLAEQQRRKNMSELLVDGAVAKAGGNDRILSFRNKAPAADEAHINSQKVLYSTGKPKATAAAAKERAVPSKPDKILDAPDLMDDFYLNLLDWSCNNHVAVALHDMLYIWNSADGSITELLNKSERAQGNDSTEDYISSVSWVKEGSFLAVGDSLGAVELWDVVNSKLMRTMRGHTDRISTLDWNMHVLASGSRSGAVHLHDVRVPDHHVGTLSGHTQEVCGMKWSPDQGRLLATGSNDNLVLLWDGRNTSQPVHSLNAHQAAVKAVSWCPWQPRTLATGGGTNCRQIKFWNTSSGNCLNSVDAGSQVSGIVWNEEYKEILTSHGFSRFQLTLWKYPSMTKIVDLKGHTSRILKLITSPDGSTVASAAADETIRFWNVWPHSDKKVEKKKTGKQPVSLFTQQRIR